MDNDHFKLIAPPINRLVPFGETIWRVCYHNAGQERFSAQRVAVYNKADNTFQLTANKQVMTQEEFARYRRRHWPLDHETGRNSQNVTLGVHSAVGRQTAKM